MSLSLRCELCRTLKLKGRSPLFVLTQFFKFVGDAYLVAHNASFDVRMLNNSFARLKSPTLPREVPPDKVLCSMLAFKVPISLPLPLSNSSPPPVVATLTLPVKPWESASRNGWSTGR